MIENVTSFENISIELKTNSNQLILSSIYRPPNTNQKEFVDCLKKLSNNIKNESKKEWVIGLDHNMDLIKNQCNRNTEEFIEKLLESELYPLITRPTRITKSTATLIDNIIVSHSLYEQSFSAIIINDLSDHLPCISVINNMKSGKGKTITKTVRDMKGENMRRLKQSLAVYDGTILPKENDVSSKFDQFHLTLM